MTAKKKSIKKIKDAEIIDEKDNSLSITNDSILIGGLPTSVLKLALDAQTEQRDIIKQFIQKHLDDGIDFGRIHVMSKDKCPDQYNCKKDYHYSKPVLFKPGQEKLFSLFQIQSKLIRDEETFLMLPNITGLVAYKCVMTRNGQFVGEGRGSAVVGEQRRDTNATIKIAEKRARMDACLSLGFSEYFAQDLDDPDYKAAADMARERAAAKAEEIDKDEFGLMPRDPESPIDDQERKLLFDMIVGYGIDKYYVIDSLKLNGIEQPETLTSGQARGLMGLIKQNVFKVPEQQPMDDDNNDYHPSAPTSAPPKEPDLVIDDDLKSHLKTEFLDLRLNSYGKTWFMKIVSGKPFGSFDKFTDNDWHTMYDTIIAIMEGSIEIADVHRESPPPIDYSEPLSQQSIIDGDL